MTLIGIIIILLFLLRKAYYAWRRGLNTWRMDMHNHNSLREYLLGNGATEAEARRPFLRHALVRACRPLLAQWQQLVALLVLLFILIYLHLK